MALLNQPTTKWSAIPNGPNSAASLELASNTNVIAIGGFIAVCDRRYRQRAAAQATSPAEAGTSTA